MTEQELYDKVNQLPSVLAWPGYGAKVMVAKDSVLELVRQLEEPQKVVVPKFVAEWIECARKEHLSLNQAMNYYLRPYEVEKWFQYAVNQDLFARAWLDGYTVEQEKLYTVEIADPEKPNGKKTNLAKFKGKVFLSSTVGAAPLTEAEIKRNHSWAWPFAREVG